MKNKTTLVLLMLAAFVLSCRIGDTVVALRATSTPPPTRTVRATFTLLPPTETQTTTAVLATNTATSTPKLPTATRTKIPATKVPVSSPIPTAGTTQPRPPYNFKVNQIRCLHSGQSFVEGLILENQDTSSGINGMRVRMSIDPGGAAVAPDVTTEDHALSDSFFRPAIYSGYFAHVVNASGAAAGQVRYVWVVDSAGKPLSDPSTGKAVFNALPGDDACWNVQVVFVKF